MGEGTGHGDFDVGGFEDEEEEFAIIFGGPVGWHFEIEAES